ncbi:MAG TPA: DNA repair protein RecO [Candidatus Saccharimonadales bacterium]|nr:DNA repair protein RecO [Candidatus Saccharimonadales bacterium]
MRPYSTEAIILRRTNYSEADRVISFLTPERGKVSAIAKGVRKPKSKLAGGLELFAVCDITLMQGRGDLALVTSARMRQFYAAILKDYDRMQLAYECIKQINRATETVSEPEFYILLQHTLAWLDDLALDWRLVELCFRLKLQILLGHGLNLATDRDGAKLQADKTYQYDFTDNAFYTQGDRGTFTSDHIKLLRLASVKDPIVLRHVAGIEVAIDDCLWLARTAES